jgi:O-antigen ligase
MYINGNKFLMLNTSRKSLLTSFGTLSLFFVAYSGYIKWIPNLLIDPFIFFSIFLIVVILFSGFRNNLNKTTLMIGCLLLFFFLWAFVSSIWGTSQIYFIEKIQKSIVILSCFFSPFFILRTRERIIEFIKLFHFFTFLVATTIFITYIFLGDIFTVLYGNYLDGESPLPDYLALGILLSSGFILSIEKTGKVWLIYKSIVLIAIVLLAPRGPLLSLILVSVIYYLFNRKLKFKWNAIIYLFLISIFILYFGNGISSRLFSRFFEISDSSSSAFSSVGSRLELFLSAIDSFFNSPIFGIGYGSFGIKFYGFEDRIEPHNIFLEILAETGIIGLALFLVFIIVIFYYISRNKVKNDTYLSTIFTLTLYLIIQSLSTTYLIDSKALFLWLSIVICYILNHNKINEGKKSN